MPLEALGLRPDEARVYGIAAARRVVRRAELDELAGLSAARLKAALSGLTGRGLVHVETGGDGSDIVVSAPPDLAGESLLLGRFAELHAAREELARLTERYRAAGRTGVDEYVELLPTHAITPRFNQIQERARTQVVIVDAPPYAGDPFSNPAQIERLASHVAYRTVYCRQGLEMYGGYSRVRAWVAAGEQARVLDQALTKFAIVDGEYGLFPLWQRDPQALVGGLLIFKSPLLDTFVSFFEMLWMCALPLDMAPTDTDLSDEDRELLTLLLAGFTDDRICRQLGVARRTVVRRVRALMDRAGAATRMQLGWQAAQLGWITAPWRADGLRRNDIPIAASEEP